METPPGPNHWEVLRWVAEKPEVPWYPSRYAADHFLDRDSLDAPLTRLRTAGYVEIREWQKGVGQGYRITPEGEQALAKPQPADFLPSIAFAAEEEEEELPAVASPAILFANLMWFGVGLFTAWRLGVGVEFLKADGHPGAVRVLFKTGAATGLSILQGDWWRLASCCFVHVGLFHLAANMLTLGMLGPVVEGLWGKRRFAVIYAVSGLVGSAVAIALHPADTLAGASGALWGILAAMIAWLLGHRGELRPGVAADWGRKIALMLFINILISFAPEVSMAGHFGGGVAGFATSLCLDWAPNKSSRRKLFGILGAFGVLILGILFLLGSMKYSEKWTAVREKNSLQQIERDRSKLQAAVGERLGKVNPAAVHNLMQQAKAPLVVPLAKLNASVRVQALAMKAAAEEALAKSESTDGVTADRFRAYFGCVIAFAEVLDAQLGSENPNIQIVLVKLGESDAAWMKAIGK